MLITHVLVASLMTLVTVGTLLAATKKLKSVSAGLLIPSLSLTAGTGVALALMVPQTFGRFCIAMSVATVGVLVVKCFYDKQLQKSL